jgi:toxoflavin biosynthesis protein ToxD
VRDAGPARLEGDLYGKVQRRLLKELERPIPRKILGIFSNPRRVEHLRWRGAAAEALGRLERGGGTQPAFWRLPYGEPVWVDVPAGEFWMGGNGKYDGKPLNRVNLPAFKIAKVPIANAQYKIFVDRAQHRAPKHWTDGKIPRGLESHPVVYVSWLDALAYCHWLSEVTGVALMLPGEVQWEKAARGAADQRAYPWGDEWDATKCNTDELGIGSTTPVGIFPEGASPYGCLDMAGNVCEWTGSHYQDYLYAADDGREDLTAGDDVPQVLRGGSFYDRRYLARCAYRSEFSPDSVWHDRGFRIMVSAREAS